MGRSFTGTADYSSLPAAGLDDGVPDATAVVRKKEDRNSLRQNRESDAREIELEASLMF